MKKTHKGLTLVEVIVSIAVFTIISLALFSSYLAMRKVVFRQEEYVRLEMVCQDINAYWDMYGEEWKDNYFRGEVNPSNQFYIGYLKYDNGQFEPTTTKSPYEIKFHYNESNELIIDYIKSSDRTYVENLNCGEKGETRDE